jgi:hypothetical protein
MMHCHRFFVFFFSETGFTQAFSVEDCHEDFPRLSHRMMGLCKVEIRNTSVLFVFRCIGPDQLSRSTKISFLVRQLSNRKI